ncbi:hypothetical protein T4B_617 [Trichinella pseudospiralis]|uniref:Uncharacterized protein n=1 Tax=Trichinella pseudospiralis TaxID=6337 RepID=A0A0V1GK69_TRIPS|nr:hypothetical protein T4B_617 [Trichinella pseudospiralis]
MQPCARFVMTDVDFSPYCARLLSGLVPLSPYECAAVSFQ